MKFLIALALAAPLFAQPCTYVVTPASFSIGAAANFTGSVLVTQTPGSACGSYLATTRDNWLHINEPGGGLPGSSVTFTADANLGAAQRIGGMIIGLQTVTVTQAGANCVFGMTPAQQTFPVGGGPGVLNVQANCSWQATSNASWLTVSASGIADTTVAYSVTPNTCVSARSGTITLQTSVANPPTLAVTQDGSPGNLSLSAYTATVPSPESDGRITVTTGDVCSWSATSDVSWIRITVGASGTGSGGISYHLLENTSAQRTGNIRVGAVTYTITQLAPAAPPVVLAAVTNAANYNTDAVSPGEILALFGNSMGPAEIVVPDVSTGTFPDLVAGTQVLFDGVAAPIIYTLKGQVSAVVPYGVAGKTSTQVQVKYQGVVSNTRTVPVQAATPAIFSLDKTGVGPGAILNQDNSINSTGNAAARLSVISLYCTGGGVTDPPTSDGELVVPPLRRLTQTTVVTIGGVIASVKYAGAAPNAVAGLTQINVEVPGGLSPALALPVIVRIGDFISTNGITVAVK